MRGPSQDCLLAAGATGKPQDWRLEEPGLAQWAPLALRFNLARANARSRVFILAAPDDTRRS